ncbi:MAG: hypothetical protein EDM82_08480 [Cyanobacteria bacterium CYA]|nr:MAG: hypothetical protein EDM82_08480 [Cyanobacteria bacterium CYA]
MEGVHDATADHHSSPPLRPMREQAVSIRCAPAASPVARQRFVDPLVSAFAFLFPAPRTA